jgi:hypothetical protein
MSPSRTPPTHLVARVFLTVQQGRTAQGSGTGLSTVSARLFHRSGDICVYLRGPNYSLCFPFFPDGTAFAVRYLISNYDVALAHGPDPLRLT